MKSEIQIVKELRDQAALETKVDENPFEARMRRVEWRAAAEIERLTGDYDRMLTSWAECRELLTKERVITAALVRATRKIEVYSTDRVAVNGAHAAINATLLAVPVTANDGRVRLVDQNGTEVIGAGPACAGCKQIPRPDCDNPACAFRDGMAQS